MTESHSDQRDEPRDYYLRAAGLVRTPKPEPTPEPARSFDDISGAIYPHLKINRERKDER